MGWLNESEARVLSALAALADCNPFLPERIELERAALGDAFVETGSVWHAEADLLRIQPNIPALAERAEALVPELRRRLAEGAKARAAELNDYEAAVRHLLYLRHEPALFRLALQADAGQKSTGRVEAFADFAGDVEHFFGVVDASKLPGRVDPAFLFAWGYQIRRAFHFTYRHLYGGSMPAARLRAAVWQSIFTWDPARYRRALIDRMGDIPTLVTGPSGTGKELVARAIALSRFVPFDADKQSFSTEVGKCFLPVNLSALSPTLIESELFGHRRGAFTGAVSDRTGWLESCGTEGTVFLDEIGELDPGIQVKLLRVLQSRRFQRIGETDERRFEGKLVAATHRDLSAEISSGRFRADFYYRLCADLIETPTLREQLAQDPGELENLLDVIAARIAGPEEGSALAGQVCDFVDRELGRDYAWPGNVRELEQCVRNVLIRGRYSPPRLDEGGSADPLAAALREGALSADALLRRYCTHVYARCGSYEEAARRLGIDRRTVKAKIDPELLEEQQRPR